MHVGTVRSLLYLWLVQERRVECKSHDKVLQISYVGVYTFDYIS